MCSSRTVDARLIRCAAKNQQRRGDALVTFLTEKGHIAVLMRRVVLERLFEQTKSELQRVPRSGRKR